jgi:hypothetical protein
MPSCRHAVMPSCRHGGKSRLRMMHPHALYFGGALFFNDFMLCMPMLNSD